MNFVKIQIIKILFKSKFYKKIQIFINFVNFYRRFINKFSNITASLTDMLKKFELTSTTKKAFNSLKSVFFVALVLLHFDFRRKIRVKTNASKFEISDIIN